MRARTIGCLPLCALLLAGPAGAQGQPDLNDLVIGWAAGGFASPVMCEIEGELVRGIRRVNLSREETPGRPAALVIRFVDMRADGAARCIDATGRHLPNLTGKIQLRRPGRSHPETALRDFKRALREDRGFEFDIAAGKLKVQPISLPPSDPSIVDYSGGKARLDLVMPATDAQRALADFPSPRKLVLSILPRAGEPLVLPLFDRKAR